MGQQLRQEHEEKKFSEWMTAVDKRFRRLVENLMIGIVVHDPSTKIQFANKAASELLGLTFDQLLGRTSKDLYWNFIREDGSRIAISDYPVNQVIATQKIIHSQVIGVQRPDRKDPVWFLCNAFPEFNEDGNLSQVIVNFTDITERHLLEKELIAKKEEALNALNLKSRFLDIAAHELRTPVTSFSLVVQLAIRQLSKGHPVEASTLLRLKAQSERISRLVVDLLDVSRLERGGLKLQLEKKDLTHLIAESLNDFKLRAPNRKVIYEPPQTSPILVKIDTVRIYQVFSNFLDNAIKYTPEDSPIEISIEILEKFVKISIKDFGPGISEEQQTMLFKPFTRGATELTERSGGLGLGLFICRSIVELHGGEAGVTSKLGSGSTFYFKLPLAENTHE